MKKKNENFPDRDPCGDMNEPMALQITFLLMLKFRYFYEKEIVHSLKKEVHEKGKRGTEVVGVSHSGKRVQSLSLRGSKPPPLHYTEHIIIDRYQGILDLL